MICHEKIQRGKNVFQINEAQTKQKHTFDSHEHVCRNVRLYMCVFNCLVMSNSL